MRKTANKNPRFDVRTAKKLIKQGMTIEQIAEKYGMKKQDVYQRLRRDEVRNVSKGRDGYALDRVRGVGEGEHRLVDPETGLVIENLGTTALVIGKMGDDRVSAFVRYHMAMLEMRQGVDKSDVPDLYQRFYRYLTYCAEHNIIPNNMNAYFAIGISRQDVSAWYTGASGTPDHRKFAETIKSFFASIHEQGALDGIMNPISSMFWQKAHDGLIEASKVEVVQQDPLGDRRSADDIAKKYENVELPD